MIELLLLMAVTAALAVVSVLVIAGAWVGFDYWRRKKCKEPPC